MYIFVAPCLRVFWNVGLYRLLCQMILNFPANVEATFWIRQTGTPLKFVGYSGTGRLPSFSCPEFASNNPNFKIFFDSFMRIILAKTLFETFYGFIDIRIFLFPFTFWKSYAREYPIIVYAFSWFLSQGQEDHTFGVWFVVAFCQSLTGMAVASVVGWIVLASTEVTFWGPQILLLLLRAWLRSLLLAVVEAEKLVASVGNQLPALTRWKHAFHIHALSIVVFRIKPLRLNLVHLTWDTHLKISSWKLFCKMLFLTLIQGLFTFSRERGGEIQILDCQICGKRREFYHLC